MAFTGKIRELLGNRFARTVASGLTESTPIRGIRDRVARLQPSLNPFERQEVARIVQSGLRSAARVNAATDTSRPVDFTVPTNRFLTSYGAELGSTTYDVDVTFIEPGTGDETTWSISFSVPFKASMDEIRDFAVQEFEQRYIASPSAEGGENEPIEIVSTRVLFVEIAG